MTEEQKKAVAQKIESTFCENGYDQRRVRKILQGFIRCPSRG